MQKTTNFMQKTMNTMEIGQKIKKIRELRNYSQEYLATQIGISQESYSKIEAGKTNLSVQKLEHIAHILNVSVRKLLEFDEKFVFTDSFQNQQHSKNIFGNYHGFEKEHFELLISQLKSEIETLKSEVSFLRELLKGKI